jgi:DNA replication protein DnaC
MPSGLRLLRHNSKSTSPKSSQKINRLFSETDLLVIDDLFLRKKVPEQAADDLLENNSNREIILATHMLYVTL